MAERVGLLVCSAALCGVRDAAETGPGVHVRVEPRLCDRISAIRDWASQRALEAAVIAPCGDPCFRRLRAALPMLAPFSIHRIEAGPGDSPARFGALVRGKVRRAVAESPVPPEGIKFRIAAGSGPISRRDLLTLAVQRAAVRVPLLERQQCRSEQRCRRCVGACPAQALAVQGGAVVLDRSRCVGCGRCATACPMEALHLPGVSFAGMISEVEGALSAPGGPRVVLFDCEPSGGDGVPVQAYRIAVPCVGMLSLRWILAPLLVGASGVLVLESPARCEHWHAGSEVRHAVSLAQDILAALEIGPDRVRVIETLSQADVETGRLVERSDSAARPAPATSVSRLSLLDIVNELCKPGDGPRRSVADERMPFGAARVDRARCSLCGVCARACPLGALAFTDRVAEAHLTFDAVRCDGCRACEASCPERAMTIRRELRVLDGAARPRLLHRGKVVRCRQCGEPVGSANLVRTVRARLKDSAHLDVLFHYCSRCRMGRALGLLPRPSPHGRQAVFGPGGPLEDTGHDRARYAEPTDTPQAASVEPIQGGAVGPPHGA